MMDLVEHQLLLALDKAYCLTLGVGELLWSVIQLGDMSCLQHLI